ncbi:MAG: DUF3568 domain-containing protein [Opitutaceae bacterium]|jgi:hypothetical protein|nr:DUF3568 domain-containing protein [Opitutaceae bacterium]
MKSSLLLGSFLAALGAVALTGCSTVKLDESGEMRAAYVAGEFRMLVNSNAPTTARATSEAFRQLGLFQIRNDLGTYDAELAARTALDEKVRVNIREVNSRQTEVRIRVDIIGDKNYSRKLFDQIERNLTVSAGAVTGGGW